MSDTDKLATAVIEGRASESDLDDMDAPTRAATVDRLIEQPGGRRWLRASSLLNEELADRLVAYDEDFNQRRYDATLAATVVVASLECLLNHAVAIAAGSGAPAFWSRLAKDPMHFRTALGAILRGRDARALEATATHLLLDTFGQFGLTAEQRDEIAISILETDIDVARAVAAEYLASASPEVLANLIEQLALDGSPTVRGFAWFSAFRANRAQATVQAFDVLGNESIAVEIRRSTLNAAGEILPTDQMIGLLTYFVAHPNADLALDAANLLQRHHRHPEVAIAAAGSPHEEVRQIANHLMDPYRGSPAAGGSRPGDPLRSDPMMELIRQLQEGETEK